MRRHALASFLAVAALIATSESAVAATTFGDPLTNSPFTSTENFSVTNVIDPGGVADPGAPVGGILTSVRIKTRGSGGSGVIRVLTLISHPDSTTYNFLNTAPEIPVEVSADPTTAGHITEVLTRRPISAGDHLGWYTEDPSGAIKEQYVELPGPGQCAKAPGSTSGPGTTTPYQSVACNNKILLVSGTVEPDCDHDGLGDETQDNDQSACGPAPGPSPNPAPGAPSADCRRKRATIVGTDGSDQIAGTVAADVIFALGGNDTVSAMAANDIVCGGPGKDTLKGGKGKDTLFGQKGRDKLKGGRGKDICKGGRGKDTASKCEVKKSI